MLGVLEAFLFEPPTTIVHGDLRSANVMFPKGNKDRNARCSIIDWGGLMQGKGVFDVAYLLLGTGMSAEIRNANEIKYCNITIVNWTQLAPIWTNTRLMTLSKTIEYVFGSPLRCMQSPTFTIVVL